MLSVTRRGWPPWAYPDYRLRENSCVHEGGGDRSARGQDRLRQGPGSPLHARESANGTASNRYSSAWGATATRSSTWRVRRRAIPVTFRGSNFSDTSISGLLDEVPKGQKIVARRRRKRGDRLREDRPSGSLRRVTPCVPQIPQGDASRCRWRSTMQRQRG